MGRIDKRLEELGLKLPECPTPVAAYIPAVEANGFVYASGQTPFVGGKLLYKGKLGRDIDVNQGYKAAKIAALRVLSEIKSVIGDLDRVQRIVRVTGYVNSMPDFVDQPLVVNGASELIRDVFGSKGEHARVAFGAAALPDDASVEIDIIAYVK